MKGHRRGFLKTVCRSVPEDKDCQNIEKRFIDFAKEYFLFIDADIPPANNLAEQTIRDVVIDRKITQGSRSDWGDAWMERFWSVLQTCQQQGRSVMLFLQDCIANFLAQQTTPTMVK